MVECHLWSGGRIGLGPTEAPIQKGSSINHYDNGNIIIPVAGAEISMSDAWSLGVACRPKWDPSKASRAAHANQR